MAVAPSEDVLSAAASLAAASMAVVWPAAVAITVRASTVCMAGPTKGTGAVTCGATGAATTDPRSTKDTRGINCFTSQQDTPTIGPYHTTKRTFSMMPKTKLALAALLLLQIVPAADAASKKHHHHEGGAYSAYDYAGGAELSPSNYNFARQVYGFDGGPYPFNIGPDGRPTPLTSDGKCWMPSQWGPPEWAASP